MVLTFPATTLHHVVTVSILKIHELSLGVSDGTLRLEDLGLEHCDLRCCAQEVNGSGQTANNFGELVAQDRLCYERVRPRFQVLQNILGDLEAEALASKEQIYNLKGIRSALRWDS